MTPIAHMVEIMVSGISPKRRIIAKKESLADSNEQGVEYT